MRNGTGKKRTIIGAALSIIVLVIIISAGILALMQLQSSGPWESVLAGYTVTSLVATPSDQAVLYACAEQSQTSASTSPSTILFNSKDGGAHWAQLSTIPGDAVNCQITINPGDGNDLYIVSGPGSSSPNGTGSEQLQHSIDGGQTWITVFPRFQDSALSSLAWYAQHLSLVSNRLYAVQWVPRAGIQPQQGSSPQTTSLPRLIMSVDGGQTWTIVDQEFQSADLELRSYVVNPSTPDTIYELIGRPTLPAATAATPSGQSLPVLPPAGTNGDLYKSVNNGKQWRAVLQDLPFGAMVQLPPDNPKIVYAGGINSLPPLRASQGGFIARVYENAAFRLHISKDGGTTWQDVPTSPNSSSAQQWLVGPDGHAYTFSGQANGMQSYDPTTNQWRDVVTPPGADNLLVATGSNGSYTVWFMGTGEGKSALYRYMIHP